jgi:hypothetical protein
MTRFLALGLHRLSAVTIAAGPLPALAIAEFFRTVPDSSILGLRGRQRDEIFRAHAAGTGDRKTPAAAEHTEDFYRLEILDTRNGYLKLIGAMEGHLEMCVWKLKDSGSLIAVYQEGCGPRCTVERFDFFRHDGSTYVALSRGHVLPEIRNDFLRQPVGSVFREMEKRDIGWTVLYSLPRRGKNIIAKLLIAGGDRAPARFAGGNRMELVWKDGISGKGPVSWK